MQFIDKELITLRFYKISMTLLHSFSFPRLEMDMSSLAISQIRINMVNTESKHVNREKYGFKCMVYEPKIVL